MNNDRDKVRKFIQENNLPDIKKVKEYLNKNPMASVMDVSLKTGVSTVTIMSLVHSGVLKLKSIKQ
ncbi:MAG: hypothetical protein WCJ94_01095 [bacterium]